MAEEPKDAAKEGEGAAKKSDSAFMKKLIRIITVIAYASGISGVGFLLSLYYIFFWDPQITGVRPPGYLRSGERIGIGMSEGRMTSLPEAFRNGRPIAHPHKMSKEFMEAYLNNYTEDMAAKSDLMDGQPTPKVMSVLRGESEVLPQHTSPTHPVPQQANDASNHLGHSPPSEQQQQQHQQQQQEQRHQHQHQQRHHQQGVEPIPTSA